MPIWCCQPMAIRSEDQPRVRELLAHHDEREAEVLEAVSHGGRTGYQVASALPWTAGAGPSSISRSGSSGWRSPRRWRTWRSSARGG